MGGWYGYGEGAYEYYQTGDASSWQTSSSGPLLGSLALKGVLKAKAPGTSGGQANVAQYAQLKQFYATQEALAAQKASASSAFTAEGGLSQSALTGSREIIPYSQLGNPEIPTGFSKFSTSTFDSPSGAFQVHYYRNPVTGGVYYGLDYKAVFNQPIKVGQ